MDVWQNSTIASVTSLMASLASTSFTVLSLVLRLWLESLQTVYCPWPPDEQRLLILEFKDELLLAKEEFLQLLLQ